MADATLDLNDIQRRMDASVASFQNDLAGIRTGRASAGLLDPIMVDAYGQKMPISQVGTVNVPEPRMIAVQVWDKAMLIPVEKAIRESTLSLNPVTDGMTVRVPLPELNEDRRRELVKVASTYSENARVAVRHVRRDGMELLKKLEKDGDVPQDDARSLSDKVQKMTDEKITEIDALLSTKEAEIMQV